jgi:hypothetical protein
MWFPIITLLSYYYDEWRSKIYLSDAVVVTEVVTRIMIDRLMINCRTRSILQYIPSTSLSILKLYIVLVD